LKVVLALQWSPCIFGKSQISPYRLPPAPPLSVFSLPTPPPSLAIFPSSSCPAPLFSAPRAPPAPRWPLPGLCWPFLAPPHRAAIARALHACRRLASTCPRSLCLLLNLKRVPELPVHSLLHSRTHICTVFLLPEHYASPELRHCLGSPSSAASATSHPQSSAPVVPPPPTDAHRPTQFHSPTLEQPDHRAGELKLRRRSVSPSPQRSAASQPLPSTPPAPHHPEKLSSYFPAALLPSSYQNAIATPRSLATRPCSPSTRRLSPSLPQHRPPP
jgi:hypothetical protein